VVFDILYDVSTTYLLYHGVLFFAFYGTYAELYRLFLRCLKRLDTNLNWIFMERRVSQIAKKVEIQKKIA